MSQTTIHLIYLGSTIFTLGMVGFLTRRSLILMFLSLELMLSGVSINLIAFANQHGNYQGHVLAILILTVAACEAAIALALIVSLSRRRSTLDSQSWSELNEVPLRVVETPMTIVETHREYPKLTPAGLDPATDPLSSDLETSQLNQANWNSPTMKDENASTEKRQNA